MSYEAAAVILNYNGLNFLQQYLAGVIENTSQHTQVIVVDNNSSDGSVEFLQKNFPDLELISLSENTGYAGGYNAGLQELKHDYFLLLNSDVEVTQHWDLPLLDRLKSNERVAAVQPKICAQFDRSKFEYAGASGGFLDREYFPFCRGRIFAELENDHGQYDKPMEVFWASGACFGIKAKLFRDFEGFDADFFAHMEEIDLCHRLKNAGYEIWVEPKSLVYHVGGGTLNMMSPFKTFLNYRNGLSLLVKNYPHSDFKWVLFNRLLLDGLSAINFLVRGLPQHSYQIWKAHRAFFKQWDKSLEKREKLLKNVREPNKMGLFHGSIIYHYFLKNGKRFSSLPEQLFERYNP